MKKIFFLFLTFSFFNILAQESDISKLENQKKELRNKINTLNDSLKILTIYSGEKNIETKFIKKGDLLESLNSSLRWTQFSNGQKCKVLEYLGRSKYKVEYKKWTGYVTEEYIFINNNINTLIESHEKKRIELLDKIENLQKEEINIIEKQNLIRKKEEEEQRQKQLLIILEKKRLSDSIKKVNDSIKLIESRIECKYYINKIDEIDNVKVVRTELYWVSDILQIQFYRKGNNKYVFFNYIGDLGCASSYSNNRSYVKVKLENNDIITFYHSWDIDCNSFHLKANLTNSEIIRLKKSPIKFIRLSGTDYYADIEDFEFKDVFINKLKCLN